MRACLIAFLVVAALPASGQSPILISSDAAAVPASADVIYGDASFDGRWAAFATPAANLSPNGYSQVFLKDLATWGLELVSLSSAGTLGNEGSHTPSVSWDARFVAFRSLASNLVVGDLNGTDDVFVRDRWSGTTVRASLGQGGVELNAASIAPRLSYDGRFLLFLSTATNVVAGITSGLPQHYLRDLWTGQVSAMALSTGGIPANAGSYPVGGGLSADGRYVVFSSDASNLVAGDANGVTDVFLRDTWSNTLQRISVNGAGQEGNSWSLDPYMSDDGRYVAFYTQATNLVQPDLNLFETDVLVYELATGQLERVSVSSSGQQANLASRSGGISWDGRYVSFDSVANNLFSETAVDPHVFVHDRVTGATELASHPAPSNPAWGMAGALSPNGRFAMITTVEAWDPNHPSGTFQVYATDRGPVCLTPFSYCTGKTNSLGCDPWVSTYGCSSASATSGFLVYGGNVRNNKLGLLFYGVSGQSATPFQGGTMCVASPKKRTPVRNSFGNATPANDCSGLWTLDMNQFAAGLGGGNPLSALLIPGTVVNCQWWGRDPGAPFNTALTNALEYVVGL